MTTPEDPLKSIEQAWGAVRDVETAHARFHLDPTPEKARAHVQAVHVWEAVTAEEEQ